MKTLVHCCWLLWLSLGLLSAQDAPKVSCRFLFFDVMGGAAPTDMATVGATGERTRCEVPARVISAPVACLTKNGAIGFVFAGTGKPLASATIPAGVKAAVLVFIPSQNAAQPWRVLVLEDSPSAYPDGGAVVANVYDKDIRCVLGEHKIQLQPSKTHGFTQPTTRDDFNMAEVMFQFQNGEAWRTASESRLRFLKGLRYLMIAYVDPASGRPRLFTCQDIPPVLALPAR